MSSTRRRTPADRRRPVAALALLSLALAVGSAFADSQRGPPSPPGMQGGMQRGMMPPPPPPPADLDTDGDQAVSRAEFDQASARRFAEADQNHDGRVTVAELSAADQARAEREQARRQQDQLQRMDRDGSGDVDEGEFIAAAEQRFQHMDRDGDGLLRQGEWHPPGPPPGQMPPPPPPPGEGQ